MRSEIHSCNEFTFSPLNKQSEEFLFGLSDYNWKKFESAAVYFTRMLLTGAPAVHRVAKVPGSSQGLYELKITAPGSDGPQLRLLCAVEGRRILVALGVDKRQRRLRPHDIRTADRTVADHIESRSKDEQRRGKKKRKRGGSP